MKYAIVGALGGIAAVAVVFFGVVALTDANVSRGAVEIEPLTTLSAPSALTRELPPSWIEGLSTSQGGETLLLACLDGNNDGLLTAADRPEFSDLVIELRADAPCGDASRSADYYVGTPSDTDGYQCDGEAKPVLVVAIGSAGSDLLDPSAGESMGLLQIVNALQQRAGDADIATLPILTTSAIFGSEPPQRSLELLLTQETARRLDEMPCLRAVIIGHSHGGATVTAVTAALDAAYPNRVFGVLLDRTTALYDRPETEFPVAIPLLNVFQQNQGWHGVALPQPNVYNIDQSYERAPIALSDGGGGIAPVGHKTLDDAPGVQRIIVDAVMTWLTR